MLGAGSQSGSCLGHGQDLAYHISPTDCSRRAPNRPAMAEPRVLPGPAVQRIASCLLQGADSQTALLSLVALAGVDRSTRAVIACLPASTLQFDTLSSCNRKTLGRRPLDREIAFSRASPAYKHDFFLAAARLFKGYSEVAFVGPIVTDNVVLEVARQLQLGLRSVRLQVRPGTVRPTDGCSAAVWTALDKPTAVADVCDPIRMTDADLHPAGEDISSPAIAVLA